MSDGMKWGIFVAIVLLLLLPAASGVALFFIGIGLICFIFWLVVGTGLAGIGAAAGKVIEHKEAKEQREKENES